MFFFYLSKKHMTAGRTVVPDCCGAGSFVRLESGGDNDVNIRRWDPQHLNNEVCAVFSHLLVWFGAQEPVVC